jgi:hypothetical protein
MKPILGGLAILLSVIAAAGQALTDTEANRLADAIYIAEGGPKAKVPYGILSIKVRDKAHARQICLNTIQNNYRRWMNSGRKGDFLDFLGNRYCPPGAGAGNRNWKRNVRHILSAARHRRDDLGPQPNANNGVRPRR